MFRIYHGDALETLRILPDASVDSVVTSPPYAMQRKSTYGGVPEREYPEWCVAWMREMRRVLAPDSSVLINIREHIRNGEMSDYVHRTRMALRDDGWIECDELIWDKKRGPPCGVVNRPCRSWERVLWFSNSRRPRCYPKAKGNASEKASKRGLSGPNASLQQGHIRKGGWMTSGIPAGHVSRVPDIVRVSQGDTGGEKNTHPAAYPVKLAAWLSALVTPPGGVVLDPFMGSGSTGKAALLEGFRFIGIERKQEYCLIAWNRMEAVRKERDEAV